MIEVGKTDQDSVPVCVSGDVGLRAESATPTPGFRMVDREQAMTRATVVAIRSR